MPDRGNLCYQRNQTIIPDRSPNEAHRTTLEKVRRLEEKHAVEKIWECEWKTMVEEDASVKTHVERLERVDPLEPREAKPRYTLRVPLMVVKVSNLLIKHPNW